MKPWSPLPALAKVILALPITVPGVRILVSGNILSEAGDTIRLMQPDATTRDFDDAVAAFEKLGTT